MAAIRYSVKGDKATRVVPTPKPVREPVKVDEGTAIQARRVNPFTAQLIARQTRSSYRPTQEDVTTYLDELDTTIRQAPRTVVASVRDVAVWDKKAKWTDEFGNEKTGRYVIKQQITDHAPRTEHDTRSNRSVSAFASAIGMAPRQHIAEGRSREAFRHANAASPVKVTHSDGTETTTQSTGAKTTEGGKVRTAGSSDDRWSTNVIGRRVGLPIHPPTVARSLRSTAGRVSQGLGVSDEVIKRDARVIGRIEVEDAYRASDGAKNGGATDSLAAAMKLANSKPEPSKIAAHGTPVSLHSLGFHGPAY